MGGHGHGHGHGHDEPDDLDESQLTADETFDPAGTVDALTLDELDELEALSAADDAEQHLDSLAVLPTFPEAAADE
jgi:hypothetical protein